MNPKIKNYITYSNPDPNHEYGNAENAREKYIIHDMVIEQP
jgi:hypothetical protein